MLLIFASERMKWTDMHGTTVYNNNEQNVTTFVTELEPIIATLNDNNQELLIAGDFNINLLPINTCNKEHFGQFLDMLLGYSLFPKITFPTRLGENSCSLIDNIFCSLSHNSVASLAGIICSKTSDHFPCFVSLRLRNDDTNTQRNKYIKVRVNNNEAYEAFWPIFRHVTSQHCLITRRMVTRTKTMTNCTTSYLN